MPNIIDILARALSLKNETTINSITPDRAGGIMYDTLLVINQMQLEGGSLLISKVYSSVSAMESDTSPTSDLTGKALKPGQLVVIVTSDSSSSDMGSEYRFNGPGSWTYVGKVGGLPMDTQPVQGSTKGITSGGVYDALAAVVGEGYKYMGVASPGDEGTDPPTPGQPVFYVAGPGSYPNFGDLTVAEGQLGLFKYSGGFWTAETVAVGKDYDAQISQLGQEDNEIKYSINGETRHITTASYQSQPDLYLSLKAGKHYTIKMSCGQTRSNSVHMYKNAVSDANLVLSLAKTENTVSCLYSPSEDEEFGCIIYTAASGLQIDISLSDDDVISEIIDKTKLRIDGWVEGYAFNLSGNEEPSGTYKLDGSACIKVDCFDNEIFYIRGGNGSTARLYAFFDDNGELLLRATASIAIDEQLKIEAPVGSRALYINDTSGQKKCYKELPYIKSEIQSISKGPLFDAGLIVQPVVTGTSNTVSTKPASCLLVRKYYLSKGKRYKFTVSVEEALSANLHIYMLDEYLSDALFNNVISLPKNNTSATGIITASQSGFFNFGPYFNSNGVSVTLSIEELGGCVIDDVAQIKDELNTAEPVTESVTTVQGNIVASTILSGFKAKAGEEYLLSVSLPSALENNMHFYKKADGDADYSLLFSIPKGWDSYDYRYASVNDEVFTLGIYYSGAVNVSLSVYTTEGIIKRVDSLSSLTYYIPDNVKQMIDRTLIRFNKWNPGKEKIVFPMISDIHANIVNNYDYKEVIKYATTYISDVYGLSFIANMGDLGADQDGSPSTWGLTDAERQFRIFAHYFGLSKIPVIVAKGNHERFDHFNMSGYPAISSDDLNNYIIKEYLEGGSVRREPNIHIALDEQTYGYYDIDGKKTRIIFLDTDENLTISTNNVMMATQVQWFANILGETPSGYNIIVIEHRPVSYYGLLKRENNSRDPQASDYEEWADSWATCLRYIAKGYIGRTIDTVTVGPITVSWDYSNADGELVGIFCAHSHFNWDKKEDGLNMIGSQGMGTLSAISVPSWGSYDNPYPINMDIVAICPSEREIKLFKIGRGDSSRDRVFTY